MANRVARLEVEIAGNDAHLRRTLNDSEQDANHWGANFVKIGGIAAGAIAGVGAAALAAGVLINNMVAEQAAFAREVKNQANIADLTTQSFQELAYATSSIDIDGDKLGGILQDMQDKLGEFRREGGGEFADFFEKVGAKVGLTADALAELSGPDALVAVKKAMDDANVSADQQITYLEEIASDASHLLPLLKNNGEQWRKMAGNYRELDVALSKSELKELQAYTQNVKDLGLVWDDLSRSVVMPFVGLLAEGAVWMRELFNTSKAEQLSKNFESQARALKLITNEEERLKRLRGSFGESSVPAAVSENSLKTYKKELAALKKEGAELSKTEGVGDLSKTLGTRKNVEDKFGRVYGPQNDPNLNTENKPKGNTKGVSKLASQQQQNSAYLGQLDSQFATELERIDLQRQARDTKIRGLVLSEQQIKAAGFESMQSLQAAYLDNSDELYTKNAEKYLQREELEQQRKYAAVERALQFDVTEEEREFAAAERRQLIIDEAFKGRADSEKAFMAASTKNWREYERKVQKAQREKNKTDIQEKADMYGGLAGLAEVFAGKQSSIHKAMFLAQKAYVLQGVLLENKGAIAKAWNSAPFPANLPIVGMTLAKTGVLKAAVSAISPPAYHTGGIIGEQPNLRPNEFPLIGLRGEEVLTETDPRHRNNLGGKRSGNNAQTIIIHNNNPSIEASAEVADDGSLQIYFEQFDEYIATGIHEGFGKTSQAIEGVLGGNREGGR